MAFLAPAALFCVVLLAVPIFVHLFKPRRMRATPFSSLRWLKQTKQRLSRRVEWHQWLLFLLRAGCILLLVVALAKPLLGLGGRRAGVDRILILDVGRDMAYQVPGQSTPLDRARAAALRVVEKSQPGDRIGLVVAGPRARLQAPLTADTSTLQTALRLVEAQAGEGAIDQCLPLLRSLAAAGGDREREWWFFTANGQTAWRHSAIHDYLARTTTNPRIQVIDVGPAAASNGWISDAGLISLDTGDHLLRVESSGVGEMRGQRTLRLTGIAGLADETQPIQLTPGQITRVDFILPRHLNLQGQVAEIRLEPPDALPGDDHYFLNLDVSWALRTLIVQPEMPREDDLGPGLFAFEGLSSLKEKKNRAIQTRVRSAKNVAANDLEQADLIILAGAPYLTDSALETLEQRVRAGAGLVLFLGRTLNVNYYNEKLHKTLQPGEGLLPMPLPKGKDQIRAGDPGALSQVLWTHPILSGLNDPSLSDLSSSRFHFYWNLTPPGKDDLVLARFDDATPALIERPFGAGRVLIFNTTANDEWTDLPRRRAFVPLLDRVTGYLASGGLRRQSTVGDSLTLPGFQSGNALKVLDPGGNPVPFRLQAGGPPSLLHVDELAQMGIYRVERTEPNPLSFRLAVNVPRGRSAMRTMDNQTLAAWWAPAACEILTEEALGQRLDEEGGGWALWPPLLFLAGLLLLAETIYVHRLCPRRNPEALESVLSRRGLLKPLDQPVA